LFEATNGSAAVGLGAIQSRIGIRQQGGRVGTVSGINRNADAEPNSERVTGNLEIIGHGGEQAFPQFSGGGWLRAAARYDGKLISPEPRNKRTIDRLAQPARDLLQEGIADRVTKHVVHLLEPVNVDT
jgi:hypothetical protein